MFVCITNIDAVTKVPCTVEPMRNGPALPELTDLQIVFENRSQWPTNTPMYYGTCSDDTDTQTPGIISVLSSQEFDNALFKERDALSLVVRQERQRLLQEKIDSLNPIRWAELNTEQREALKTYRQLLLDIPQQAGFPWEVIWPSEKVQ